MVKYTLKRLLLIIPVIIAVTALIFCLLSLVPGDPAKLILGNEATVEMLEAKREQLGLNDPLIVRMFRYMEDVFFHLDFGTSYYNSTPILQEILSRLPRTITVAGFGVLLTTILGIPLGVMAAVKQNGFVDRLCMVISMVGVALPEFCVALLLVQLFSTTLGWLPSHGVKNWLCYIMPVIAIGLNSMAGLARNSRNCTLEAIRSDYVTTARSKGVKEWKVIVKHVLPKKDVFIIRKPPYKPMPREKIQKKMHFMRKMTAFMDKRMAGSIVGKERILPTDKGNIRTLTYGFDNPEKAPVLVDIHGGGFVMGNPEMDDPFMMQFVEKCGVKVISIGYTLSPDVMFPVALEECHAVICYLKEHQEELHVDGDRIVIMGHSAGGNFCAAIGLMDNEEQKLGLKGIILDYPPTDILTDPFDKPLPKGCLPPNVCRMFNAAYCTPEEAKNPLISPTFATAEMVSHFPPTLVITAGQDSLAGETEVFKDTLVSAGVDVTFKRFEGVIHGFTITPPAKAKKQPKEYAASLEAWQMMIGFVNRNI